MYARISCSILRVTEKGVKIEMDDPTTLNRGRFQFWLPRSAVLDHTRAIPETVATGEKLPVMVSILKRRLGIPDG